MDFIKVTKPPAIFATSDLEPKKISAKGAVGESDLDLNHLESKQIFVASPRAWPLSWKKAGQDLAGTHIIWTSGVETWKVLAKRGIWVNGSQDGLGENQDFHCENLLATDTTSWLKLTHSSAREIVQESSMRSLATYEIDKQLLHQELAKELAAFEDVEFYFWSSASQFLKATELVPTILEKYHATGPGHTYDVVLAKVSDRNRVFAFINEMDWRNQCTQ